MSLIKYGLNNFAEGKELPKSGLDLARITAEHKQRYEVITNEGRATAEITGNLRYSAEGREDLPAVGDWVEIIPAEPGHVYIQNILERKSLLKRKAPSSKSEFQVIASNVDTAFLIQGMDHDYNPNRLERYLTLCANGGVEPVIIFNKIDLIGEDELNERKEYLKIRHPGITITCISNLNKSGLEEFNQKIISGKTYCLLGSSGVGKSTLLNNLMGEEVMKTSEISETTGKGRHTTSHRQMFILPNGGIFIDVPGMREVGITDGTTGIEDTFDLISELAESCQFSDCTHTNEPGCAIIEAIDEGSLQLEEFENYQKLKREEERVNSSVAELRAKDKSLGKLYKTILQGKKNRKGI